MCLDQSQEQDAWAGATAVAQGYGTTETGTNGLLLEVNVTVISNKDCREMLRYNTTQKRTVKKKVKKALPGGLTGLFCSQGEQNEEGVFAATCKGDSGGPLITRDLEREERKTLIGIVSGGAGCGQGVPVWYTDISYHADWFNCILDKTNRYFALGKFNQKKVEEECKSKAQPLPTCIEKKDLLIPGENDTICK